MHLIINLGELVHSLTRLIYFISDTVCVMLCVQFITTSDLKVERGFTCSTNFTFCRAFHLQFCIHFYPS